MAQLGGTLGASKLPRVAQEANSELNQESLPSCERDSVAEEGTQNQPLAFTDMLAHAYAWTPPMYTHANTFTHPYTSHTCAKNKTIV